MAGDPPDGFLDGDLEHSDTLFLVSPHHRVKVTPLFDAQDTFKAIEETIVSAQHSVYLAYWDLQTDLETQSDSARDRGLDSWTDLLLDAAKRGVTVRVLLNDFDPDLSRSFHRDAWVSYDRLVRGAKQKELLQGLNLKRFQVVCALHEAQVRPDDKPLATAILLERGKMIADLNRIAREDGLTAALQVVDMVPRSWEIIQLDRPSKTFSNSSQLRPVHVASNHQKVCTVDRKVAFCGGIDAKQGVLDNRRHEQPPFRHDIHCMVEGPAVVDVERNFVGMWNHELTIFKKFVSDVNKHKIHHELTMTPVAPIDDFIYRLPLGSRFGYGQVQVLRTITGADLRHRDPSVLRDDVEKSYKKLIGMAKEYIYIENQYLRWPKVADWIIDRHKSKKNLKVIMVLPNSPEEAFSPGELDQLTKHGMHLQYEILKRLKKELKNDIGIFTLGARKATSAATSATIPAIYNSPVVYVHSKICIVDDAFSIIGSANLNGRSMRVDNELCIGWLQPAKVRAFRLHLWEELLGIPRSDLAKITPHTFLPLWVASAHNNSMLRPQYRTGFVLPYDLEASKGAKSDFIPDIYV